MLDVFEENIDDILVDLEDDDPRNDYHEARLVELSDEVKKNEDKIRHKMKKIKESQPNKEKEEAQVERNKTLKIDMETLNSKIKDLTTTLAAVIEGQITG